MLLNEFTIIYWANIGLTFHVIKSLNQNLSVTVLFTFDMRVLRFLGRFMDPGTGNSQLSYDSGANLAPELWPVGQWD